jgi:hypothetical protein
MELLLNSIWLLTAISAFFIWQTKNCGAAARHEHIQSFRFLALTCALILLFPVISLTDDLHAEQLVMEDCSGSILKARAAVQGSVRAERSSSPAVLGAILHPAPVLLVVTTQVVSPQTGAAARNLVCRHEGRSPPL